MGSKSTWGLKRAHGITPTRRKNRHAQQNNRPPRQRTLSAYSPRTPADSMPPDVIHHVLSSARKGHKLKVTIKADLPEDRLKAIALHLINMHGRTISFGHTATLSNLATASRFKTLGGFRVYKFQMLKKFAAAFIKQVVEDGLFERALILAPWAE